MTQMSGLVRLGRRSVSRPGSPSFNEEEEEELCPDTPPPPRHPLHTHIPQVTFHASLIFSLSLLLLLLFFSFMSVTPNYFLNSIYNMKKSSSACW